MENLREILSHKPVPEVLIVGAGYSGLVRVMPEVEEALKTRGIKLIVQSTRDAYKTFNELLKSGRLIAGTFHLTC